MNPDLAVALERHAGVGALAGFDRERHRDRVDDDLSFGIDPVRYGAMTEQFHLRVRAGGIGADSMESELAFRPSQGDGVKRVAFGGETDVLGVEGPVGSFAELMFRSRMSSRAFMRSCQRV